MIKLIDILKEVNTDQIVMYEDLIEKIVDENYKYIDFTPFEKKGKLATKELYNKARKNREKYVSIYKFNDNTGTAVILVDGNNPNFSNAVIFESFIEFDKQDEQDIIDAGSL
jgi:hypothetical protein